MCARVCARERKGAGLCVWTCVNHYGRGGRRSPPWGSGAGAQGRRATVRRAWGDHLRDCGGRGLSCALRAANVKRP